MKRSLPLMLAVIMLLYISCAAEAALKVTGESIWKLGYGSRYYSTFGWKLGLGGFLASQEIRLDVSGEVIEGLRLDAHIDNTKGDVLQQLTVSLDWKGLKAGGGSIQLVPASKEIGRAKATLFGLYIGYEGEDFSVLASGGRAQGTRASKSFRGATASETIEYVIDGPYFPMRQGSYLTASLEGLWQAPGASEYDPDFDVAGIVFEPSSPAGELEDFMALNGLGFIVRTMSNPDGTLIPGDFSMSSAVDGLSGVSGAYIILRSEPVTAVRALLTELIRAYNAALGLSGDAARRYPFVAGSETDLQFLDSLLQGWTSFATASKASGDIATKIPYDLFGRGLIYPLGFTGVIAESVNVMAVAKNGARIPLGAVTGANWVCYEDRGYLEMTLPSDFLDAYSRIVATFSYRLSQGLYFLGGGIVRGSVSAKLDGAVLKEGQDFEVDYETGIFMLLSPIPDESSGELTVDFEYQSPGSKAWMALVGASYEPASGLRISMEYSYASDAPYLAEDESTVPRERSFDHLLALWVDWAPKAGLELSAGISASASVFPGDMSLRPNAYNYVRAIEVLEDNTGGKWWVVMHSGGASALSPHGTGWRQLKLPASLAGSEINAACSSSGKWYFASSMGIASLDADYAGYGEGFADIASLWRIATTKDGLPSAFITSIAESGGSLFAGTKVGLAVGGSTLDGSWQLFRPSDHPAMIGGVTALAWHPSGLIIATEGSVAAFDGASFVRIADYGAYGASKADLDEGQSVLLATESGFSVIGPGLIVDEFPVAVQVNAVCGFAGFVYYAGPSGLYAFDTAAYSSVRLYEGHVTAAMTDGSKVYSGGIAGQDYELPLIRLDFPMGEEEVLGSDVHGIDGRDKKHYIAKDPAENTLYGAAGYVKLSYSYDTISASAAIRVRSEGSLAAAGPGKPDSGSLSLSLSWKPNQRLAFSLLEAIDISKPFSYMQGKAPMILGNTVQAGMSWSGPLSVGLIASHSVSKGFGTDAAPLSQSVSASTTLQYSAGPLRLTGSLSAAYKAVEGFEPYAYSAAGASAYLQAGKNTVITLSYSEPTPFGGLLAPSGNYRSVAASVRYSAYMTYGNLSLNAKGGYKWDVRNISDSADVSAGLVYNARQISLFGANYIPRGELNIAYYLPQGAESRLIASMKLSSGFKYGILGLDSNYQHKLTYMIGTERLTNSGDASLTAYFSGPGWIIRPSLLINGAYTLETRKYQQTEGTFRVGGRLNLASSGAVTNQASASYYYSNLKGGRHEIAVSDSIAFSALSGSLGIGAGINASASLNPQNLQSSSYKASVNASISYKFDKSWSAKLLGEAGVGSAGLSEAPKPIYGFELTVALRF